MSADTITLCITFICQYAYYNMVKLIQNIFNGHP